MPDVQQVRFAVVMTGGASLAIWMGGVAREINLLTGAGGVPATGGATGTGDDAVRALYTDLCDLMGVEASVDVLSGTSAGGINAAALGYANVCDGNLAPLRDLWLTDGAFARLLRDPAGKAFPSLMQGDDRLLPGISAALAAVAATGKAPADRPGRPTSIFVTTTFLRAENDLFTDDLGTTVVDADHHGLFTFAEDSWTGAVPDDALARARLALAARASAAFPAAFEPTFVPVGAAAGADHPDMAGIVNAARSHFAADGGILVNRPIAPALNAIFRRPADQQVRRVLAYVLPTSSDGPPTPDETAAAPPAVGRALLDDLGAALNQTIAGDLTNLRDHNDRTRVHRDTRRQLAALKLAGGARLVDADTYALYRRRRAAATATAIVDALLRQVAERDDPPVGSGTAGGIVSGRDELLAVAAARAADALPDLDDASNGWRLGAPALDAVVSTLMTLVREAYVVTANPDERAQLAAFTGMLHDAMPRAGGPGGTLAWTVVSQTIDAQRGQDLEAITRESVERWMSLDQADMQAFQTAMTSAWNMIGTVAAGLRVLLTRLTDFGQPAAAVAPAARRPAGLSVDERRALAVGYLSVFVAFLPQDADGCVRELIDLHIAEHVLSGDTGSDQAIELVQISADTRTLLDPARDRASGKLTGLQLFHFGAFLKRSWRASDWMWGRLDGAGWMVAVLLDPRRMITLRDEADSRDAWISGFMGRLTTLAGSQAGPKVVAELGFLSDNSVPVPRSLPQTALWVAQRFQRVIAAGELPCVADAVRRDRADGADPDSAEGFLTAMATPVTPDTADAALRACRVSAETFHGEAGSALVTETLAQTAAVATAMIATAGTVPAPLRPAVTTARTVTRLAYAVTERVTHGRRDLTTILGLVLLGAGAAASTSTIGVLGGVGVLAAFTGFVLLALVVWRRFTQIMAAVAAGLVVLLAIAGFIPALSHRLFRWLGTSVVPYLSHHATAWAALVVFLLVPPVTTLAGLVRHRRPPAAQDTSTQR